MNERYTYGYNSGWNVENEYINSLGELMVDYNEQVSKLEQIENLRKNTEEETNNSIKEFSEEIDRNNNFVFPIYSDEQIKEWYDADYSSYNTSITFERYKANILKELENSNNFKRDNLNSRNEELSRQIAEKNEYLSRFISRNKDEYVANQYHLAIIKNETRKSIFKKKNELELLLSEKNIELSSVLLEQRKNMPQRDEHGNILNKERLAELRKKYDEIWLEIRKIEYALQKLNEMFLLVEFTKEEADLMMRGLNPQQKSIYNHIIDTQIKNDVTEQIQNIEERKSDTLESADTENIEPVETAQDTESKIDEENLEYIKKWAREEAEENKVHEEEKDLSFEGIIKKVSGDSSFTKGQSSRYAASKIKVFTKPQTNDLGFIGKVTSIGKSIIGIIPKAAMKLYGKLISNETKGMFQDIETRAMNLSDYEVETLLHEYNDKLDRIPKGFEQIIKPRVNLYVSKRVEYLQKSFNESMYQIAASQKSIEESKDESEYFIAAPIIKGLINIQIEVSNLLKVSNVHSFKSQLKSLYNKLTYAGARFENAKEYDPSLWSKVSGLSQKIEYSLDPKEVVDSYTEREKIYKEHGKHKSYLTEANLEKLNNNSKKEEKIEKVDPTFKKSEEIRSLIEGLKSMKAELTEQDVKEIEGLLR